MLQRKYSDIQKETERKQPQQNETESKMENSCDKSKTPSKTIRKDIINSSSKTPIVPKHPIFLVQRFSCKERTKRTILHKIRPKMSKELKVVMKKKKQPIQRKMVLKIL